VGVADKTADLMRERVLVTASPTKKAPSTTTASLLLLPKLDDITDQLPYDPVAELDRILKKLDKVLTH
jgi:hypothetical protein